MMELALIQDVKHGAPHSQAHDGTMRLRYNRMHHADQELCSADDEAALNRWDILALRWCQHR